jgi:hypothetical protein
VKRRDYEAIVNGLECNTGTKVINIALTHGGDSVQLHMDQRDEVDDIGYTVTMTREAAQILGEALIEYAASRDGSS